MLRKTKIKKKGVTFLFQVIIEILLLIAVFAILFYFATSSFGTKKASLDIIAFLASSFDNATIKIESDEFNASRLGFEDNQFILREAIVFPYKAKLYAKKGVVIEEGKIKIQG
jgi:flagellar basal body-associated protein FliL